MPPPSNPFPLLMPFIDAAIKTMATMCGLKIGVFSEVIDRPTHIISGVLGFSGKMSGAVAIRFPEETLRIVMRGLLKEEMQSITADIMDAVGELINIVGGAAKNRLNQVSPDFGLNISIPNTIHGVGHQLIRSKSAEPYHLYFSVEGHLFELCIFLQG